MTQAKAQTVVSALIGAGYRIEECAPDSTGSWYVIVHSTTPVDSATFNMFAVNQAVTGTTDRAKFQ